MAPTTSYWPPTRSPGLSFGVNENLVRHFGQNPSARPGWPSRLRPTGAPQAGQKRFSSATSATAITASRGSPTGDDGTVVTPAPSRADRTRRMPVRLVRCEPGRLARDSASRAVPMGRLASRCDPVLVLMPPPVASPEPADPSPAVALAGAATSGGAPAGAP